MPVFNDEERDRLNRRIRVLPKSLSRELKSYRQRISSPAAIDRRGAARIFVPKGDSGFFEGEDVISLCHAFLDERNIPYDPTTEVPCNEC